MPGNQGRWALLMFVCVVLCASARAVAQDAVKLSDIWIEGVTVTSIRDGQVYYLSAIGASIARPLDQLQGMRLEAYPALGEAEALLERGDGGAAVELLKRVASQAHEPWVKDYAGMLCVRAYAAADRAQEAADTYIDMVVSDADYAFIADAPVDVVASADAAVRKRVAELAGRAADAVAVERKALLEALIEAAGEPVVAAVEVGAEEIASAGTGGLVLSASAPPGTIVNLFKSGRYALALEAADEGLRQPGRTAAELYLKGMAQLAIAERATDPAGYKSAGLSFMRVVTFFPTSAVSGPAWLEAGYVHQKIGRADLAYKLYLRARPLITEREDPAYYARLNRLIAELEAAADEE